MKARIRQKENRVREIIKEFVNQEFDIETKKLKNKTEVLQFVKESIITINQNRDYDGEEKFLYFEPLENGTYIFYDEFNDTDTRMIANSDIELLGIGTSIYLLISLMIGEITEDEYIAWLKGDCWYESTH